MKKSELNRFLPYEADYELLSKCRDLGSKCLWGISGLSIMLPIISLISDNIWIGAIYSVFNLIYFILIVGYYVLNIYTETFLYPATARKRRKGFIDNSLGSKFLEKNVEGYYTNDNLV